MPSQGMTQVIQVDDTTPSVEATREPIEVAIVDPERDQVLGNVQPSLSAGIVEPTIPVDRDEAKLRLTQLVAETKTATWNARITEIKGDETEKSIIKVAWAGPEKQRIKVRSGRGAGKTLIVKGDTVASGWIKVRHTNSMVKTIRGNSLKLNGYLDDLAHLVNDWDSVTIDEENESWTIQFIASNGIESKLWLNPTTLKATKLEAYEEGRIVGLYEYASVVYNPILPATTWKK